MSRGTELSIPLKRKLSEDRKTTKSQESLNL